MSSDSRSETTQVVAFTPPSAEVVSEITTLHSETHAMLEGALDRAKRIGELLAIEKAKFPKRAPKGEGFGEWVENNLPFTDRTARNYIRIFENQEALSTGSTVREALGAMAKPKAIPETVSGNEGEETARNPTPMGEEIEAEVEILDSEPTRKPAKAVEVARPFKEPRDEKQAERLALYFGTSIEVARGYVLSRKPKKPKKKAKGKTKKDQTAPKVHQRTLRVILDKDAIIEEVARKEGRSYADVANELLGTDLSKFRRKHKV